MYAFKNDNVLTTPFNPDFTRPKVCVRCDATYILRENLGQYKCKYHPERLNMHKDGLRYPVGKFECCGKSSSLMSTDPDYETDPKHGCIRCDHSDASYAPTKESIMLPNAMLSYFNPLKESTTPMGSGYTKITRYDTKREYQVFYEL